MKSCLRIEKETKKKRNKRKTKKEKKNSELPTHQGGPLCLPPASPKPRPAPDRLGHREVDGDNTSLNRG